MKLAIVGLALAVFVATYTARCKPYHAAEPVDKSGFEHTPKCECAP